MGTQAKKDRRERRAIDRMVEGGNTRGALAAAMKRGQRRIAEESLDRLRAPLTFDDKTEDTATPAEDTDDEKAPA